MPPAVTRGLTPPARPAMPPAVRLLPFASLAGPAHMAADDALLLTAAAGGPAALRFYTWAPPTLSLGYFQPAAARLSDRRLAGLPWVRRATGGAALVHHHELTYALALPPGPAWQPAAGDPWPCRMHRLIGRALARFGAAVGAVGCGRERKLGDVLCFLDQTAADLVAAGAKVVGSAQRKAKGAVLQHGGILLRRSEYAPALPGLLELTGVDIPPEPLAAAVAAELAADTGWRVEPGDWTADELAARRRIEAERYADPGWNDKR